MENETDKDRELDAKLSAALGLEPDAEAADLSPDRSDQEPDSPDPLDAPSAPGGMSAEDEQFATEWLARAGVPRAKLNRMLDEDPELALALARKQKDTQDTIARLRREAGSASDEDDARPSYAAPGQTKPASPAELRRADILALVEDEYGEEQRQALERQLRGQEQTGADGQGPDPRVLATVAASRERLVAGGHDELRDNARYLEVLRAADALRAADPTLDVELAIDEAAEVLRARSERAVAGSQQRRSTIARTQPSVGVGRGVQLGLNKEQALDAHIDALLAGDKAKARAIADRYKLHRR
jgi:hypothetical protein